MKKIIYQCASSVDGYIAAKDKTFDDFLMDGPHVKDFLKSFSGFDTVIMGRGTYEVAVKAGITNPYPSMKSYVFSTTMKTSPDLSVELVSENAVDFIKNLKFSSGENKTDIFFAGAEGLATTLFENNLIDEIWLKINPILMGEGLGLTKSISKTLKLELLESKVYSNSLLLVKYKVM